MTRMIEPALSRLAPLAMRVAALLATPLAPLYGLAVAWRLYHPPRPRRRRAPAAFGLHPASTFPVLDTLARLSGAVCAVLCDSGPTRDLPVIISSLPRLGLLPVPQVLQAAPARTLWQAVYRRLATAMLDPPADWPPAAQHGVDRTPMLFVVGDRDAVTPVNQVRAVARRYPRAELLVMPGTGHLRAINVDRDAYPATVLDFLTQALNKDPVAASQHTAAGS
jgi:pimeloyl-ACP methyl ester carboxylesterase